MPVPSVLHAHDRGDVWGQSTDYVARCLWRQLLALPLGRQPAADRDVHDEAGGCDEDRGALETLLCLQRCAGPGHVLPFPEIVGQRPTPGAGDSVADHGGQVGHATLLARILAHVLQEYASAEAGPCNRSAQALAATILHVTDERCLTLDGHDHGMLPRFVEALRCVRRAPLCTGTHLARTVLAA